MELKNAKIVKARIKRSGGSNIVIELSLTYGNTFQTASTVMRDNFEMFKTLQVCGVDEWSKVEGSYVRVNATHEAVKDLWHILDDNISFSLE